jgi:hypothetical protein
LKERKRQSGVGWSLHIYIECKGIRHAETNATSKQLVLAAAAQEAGDAEAEEGVGGGKGRLLRLVRTKADEISWN